MNLRILDEAVEEFEEATLWYFGHSNQLGELFAQSVQQTFLAIQSDPLRFAPVEFAEVTPLCRRARVANYPYIVIFQVLKTEIVVLSVVHTSRDPERWVRRVQ